MWRASGSSCCTRNIIRGADMGAADGGGGGRAAGVQLLAGNPLLAWLSSHCYTTTKCNTRAITRPCHCEEAKPTRQSGGVATAVTRTTGLLRCARNDKGMLAMTKTHVIARRRSRRGNLVVLRRRSQGRRDCCARNDKNSTRRTRSWGQMWLLLPKNMASPKATP